VVVVKWFCFNGEADGQVPSLASPLPPSTSNATFGLSQIPEENVYGSLLFKILAPSQHNSYYLLNENQAVVNAPLLQQSGALENRGQTHSVSPSAREASPRRRPSSLMLQRDEKQPPVLGPLKHFLFGEKSHKLCCFAVQNLTSQSQTAYGLSITPSERLYLRHLCGNALLCPPSPD